jgi:hypothetical protein
MRGCSETAADAARLWIASRGTSNIGAVVSFFITLFYFVLYGVLQAREFPAR